MAQLMPLPLTVSCFSKIQIVFPFLVTAHPVSSGKRAAKRVCVCVVEHKSEKLDAKQSPTEAHAARLSPSPSPYLLLYFGAVGRFKQDAELVTGENVLVETVEKAHEVTSTLFIDNCSVADDGDVRVTAENKAGTASHTAKLTVLGKLSCVKCLYQDVDRYRTLIGSHSESRPRTRPGPPRTQPNSPS